MLYKNSIKLLFSNFNLVWKIALYVLIVSVVAVGLMSLCLNPIIELVRDAGFFDQVVELYSDFLTSLNLANFFESISSILNNAFDFVVSNISQIWLSVICVGIVLFFLNAILYNLTHMPASISLHLYVGSLTRQGFFASFTESFGKNLRAQLCQYLISLPLNLIYFGLFVLSLNLFGISFFMNLLAVFIIVVGFILLMSFKHTLFSAWIPTMVILNYGVLKSFKSSIKITFRRFGRVFSNAIGMVVTLIVLNMFLGIFTFMAGLIISVPISILLYNIFGVLVVYEGQGMRYYVDIYNVITPNKKEKSDKLSDMKYVV